MEACKALRSSVATAWWQHLRLWLGSAAASCFPKLSQSLVCVGVAWLDASADALYIVLV